MAFAEDFTVFFDTDDFADEAAYTNAPAAAVTINGIFNNDFVEFDGVTSSGPVFLCAAADVADNPQNDTLAVSGSDYIIREFNLDGSGLVLLGLELV